jgi:hypothetical protein
MYAGTISDVLVFKTNIKSKEDIEKASLVLSEQPAILRWNVDCDDIDHVLRVETEMLQPSQIITLITCAGFACEELPD